jgi:ZIP family zinc transporter
MFGAWHMVEGNFAFLLLASGAAIASPVGGWLGSHGKIGTLFLSISVGMAAGVLLGTFTFEMIPTAGAAAGKDPNHRRFRCRLSDSLYLRPLHQSDSSRGTNPTNGTKLSRLHRIQRARGSKLPSLLAAPQLRN